MGGREEVTGPELVELLEEGRRRERAQTRFYRRLAAEADLQGDARLSERLNELHADEQHHLSRLTARLLELEHAPAEPPASSESVSLEGWTAEARDREGEEIRWYEEALRSPLDSETRRIFEEILESERHHRRDLGGKWMSA